MPTIEKDLWYRIKDGDSSAFGELYDGFAGAMFSLSLEILGDRWEAEEVIQDIFAFGGNLNPMRRTRENLPAGYWY
jgi:hypothetical protein